MDKSKMANPYSPEVSARAVCMVLEHQGSYETRSAAIAGRFKDDSDGDGDEGTAEDVEEGERQCIDWWGCRPN